MFTLSSILLIVPPSILLAPFVFLFGPLVVTYLRDEKGFRKYPTQNWASGLTYLAYGWEVGREHKEIHTKRLHNALQDHRVIRIGPNWLSFSRSQAAKDIYGFTSKCVKAATYDAAAAGGLNLINISEKSVHRDRRRMVASFYAPKNIEEWEPRVAGSMAALMKQMDDRCTEPTSLEVNPRKEELTFDAVNWLFLFSAEVLFKITLSKDTFFLRNGNDKMYFKDASGEEHAVSCTQSVHAGTRALATILWDAERVPLWQKVTDRFSKKYADNWEGGNNFHLGIEAFTRERMERHAHGEVLNDLVQPMLEDRNGEDADITMADRVSEVEAAINAGTDSPAISSIMTIFYLLRNPRCYAKLREELDGVLSPADAVAPWYKIRGLPYLRACIDEAMRVMPPVATDLVRRTPPDTNTVIDGVVVPPNTNVSIAAYTAHRDPAVFEDPDVYNPDRWLAKGSDHLKEMLAVFIPFSTGPRGCIGRNISILMQAVCVATLIHHYEFSLPSKTWEIEFEEWFNVWPLKMPLKVWRRDPMSFSKDVKPVLLSDEHQAYNPFSV